MPSGFATNFRNFLQDEDNRTLLQQAICGPLMDEVRSLRAKCEEKDELIDSLSDQVTALKCTIQSLEASNDDLEQYQRRNSLRISGIPEEDDEDCMELALKVANEKLRLDPPLEVRDIDRTHRSGQRKPGKPKQILVKFATYHQRRRFYEARKSIYTSGNTVFVNEDLTKTRGTILWTARKAKREEKLKECWSSDGRIFIRRQDNSKHQVKTLTELNDHLAISD